MAPTSCRRSKSRRRSIHFSDRTAPPTMSRKPERRWKSRITTRAIKPSASACRRKMSPAVPLSFSREDCWESQPDETKSKAASRETRLNAFDPLVLSDAQWARMSHSRSPRYAGSTDRKNRMFVEGVLWIVCTGAPWRYLPEVFGRWNRALRPSRALLFGLGFSLVGNVGLAQTPALQSVTGPKDGIIEFDIPAQPLASALKLYSTIARVELFYESSLTDGRYSSPIRAALAPETALLRLLEGTGLSVKSFGPGTMTILPPPKRAGVMGLEAAESRAAEFIPYFALVQTGLRLVFCRSPVTQTDASEFLIRLWIASSGVVSRAELLSSTGSEERDRAYAAAVRTLAISEPPPPRMPQPITLMILPRNSRTAAECPQVGASGPVRSLAHD